MTQKTQTDIVD